MRAPCGREGAGSSLELRLVQVVNSPPEILNIECIGNPNDCDAMSVLALAAKGLLVALYSNDENQMFALLLQSLTERRGRTKKPKARMRTSPAVVVIAAPP